MGEDNFLELFEGFRIADQAGERRDAGAGREHVEPLAGCQRIEHQRAGRLLAHQNLIAGLDRLQMRGQRPIRHLDREEFEFLVPGRAGDRIGAVDRLAVDHQADHREFAGAETELCRTRHAEAEQPVRIVRDAGHRFDEHAGGRGHGKFFDLGRSIHLGIQSCNDDDCFRYQRIFQTAQYRKQIRSNYSAFRRFCAASHCRGGLQETRRQL